MQMSQSQSQSAPDEESGAKKATAAGLLSGYKDNGGAFDELLAKNGEIFPHYAKLLGELEEFGAMELARRVDASQRFVNEHGITYNVYGDPRGMERPWQLDPIPLVVAPQEWQALEAGLIQRATLLNKILADCYGGQELHPIALAFARAHFRPAGIFCVSVTASACRVTRSCIFTPPTSHARRTDAGGWCPTAHRFLPERVTRWRIALSPRAFCPNRSENNHVHRPPLDFFSRCKICSRNSRRARPARRGIVMLNVPGPHNETYFEQAYLARYLGYMPRRGP